MIQQSINQLLGTAALATKFSPSLADKRELRKLEKQEGILEKKLNAAEEGAVKYAMENEKEQLNPELEAQQLKNISNIYGEKKDVYKKGFDIDPSEARYSKFASAQTQEAALREQANKIAKQKIENAVQQDQEFKAAKDKVWAKFGGN